MSLVETKLVSFVQKKTIQGVVTLTLQRPQAMNALSRALLLELATEVAQVSVRSDVRAVVFAGDARAFCAGADLKERAQMSPEEVRMFLNDIRSLVENIAKMPMPTIAAVEGVAFGGGCELALACDFRILGKSAQIGLTECALGIIPGAGGTQRLPRLVGLAKAKELIFTARRLGADEAFAIGLADFVVDAGAACEKADELATAMQKCAPLAVQAAKAAIDGGVGVGLAEGLLLEARCYEVTLRSEDRNEALRAFAEKRPPVFQGR